MSPPLRVAVRLFVAVEVPRIGTTQPERSSGAPEHLTLRFLGEVSPERIAELQAVLAAVARETPPFDLVLEGVGAFPNSRNPRVVWVGATTGREEVSALAVRVARSIEPIVPGADRESFVPHLTLFRVRSPPQRRRAAALLDGTEPPPAPRTVRVHEICLKESTLSFEGASHRVVAAWPLTGTGVRPPPGPPDSLVS